VVEGRARQHQAVEQRHGGAQVDPVGARAQHAAGDGAVDVERAVDADVGGRNDEGLRAVGREADVDDEALVEDRVEDGAIGVPALGVAAQPGPVGDGELFHAPILGPGPA
jgi:hypothetical protein